MYATAYNASDSPVVIDREGRTLEGGAFGTVETTSSEVKNLAAKGLIHVFPKLDKGPGQSDEAIAAIETTEAATKRAASLAQAAKEDLATIAGDAGIPRPDDLDKDELVYALAMRPDFDFRDPLKAARDARKGAGDAVPVDGGETIIPAESTGRG